MQDIMNDRERQAREELRKKRLRRVYSEYVQQVIPGYYMTHFHKFLCDEIQAFEEAECPDDISFQVFL